MGVVYHNARAANTKRYVHGKGLHPVNAKRYVYGKGIIDTVLSLMQPMMPPILHSIVKPMIGHGVNDVNHINASIEKVKEDIKKMKIKKDIKSGNGFKYV